MPRSQRLSDVRSQSGRCIRSSIDTGLVGAAGGLGGFFPPLVLGVIRGQTGSYTLGFVFLSGFAFVCVAMNYLVFLRRQGDRETAAAD